MPSPPLLFIFTFHFSFSLTSLSLSLYLFLFLSLCSFVCAHEHGTQPLPKPQMLFSYCIFRLQFLFLFVSGLHGYGELVVPRPVYRQKRERRKEEKKKAKAEDQENGAAWQSTLQPPRSNPRPSHRGCEHKENWS